MLPISDLSSSLLLEIVTWAAGVWSSGACGVAWRLQEVCHLFRAGVLSPGWGSQGWNHTPAASYHVLLCMGCSLLSLLLSISC